MPLTPVSRNVVARFLLLFNAALLPVSLQPCLRAQAPPANTPVTEVARADGPVGRPATPPAEPNLDAPPSLMLADTLLARGRWLAAIRIYGQLQPVTADIQNRMGVAQERMRMMVQAQTSFEAALKLDPNHVDATNNLATIYHSRGDLKRAEKLYRRAIKLQPTHADAHQNLGALLYGRRKFKQGDAMYREAVRLDPTVMERTAQRGVQAAGNAKNQAEVHYHLASTFAATGNGQLAMTYLRKCIGEGFHDRNRLLHDASFADLRTSEPFLRLVDDLKTN